MKYNHVVASIGLKLYTRGMLYISMLPSQPSFEESWTITDRLSLKGELGCRSSLLALYKLLVGEDAMSFKGLHKAPFAQLQF